jgi:hypothetical protein
MEGIEATDQEGAEHVPNGLATIAEVCGDLGGGPPRIGEKDHLDPVADSWKKRLPPPVSKFITGCIVD